MAIDVGRYRDDGVFSPVKLMEERQALTHRARLEAIEAEHGMMHYKVKPHLVMTSAAEIARNPNLLDAVEDVLGPDILLWDSGYVIKEPNTQGFVSWHQDLTYWGLSSDDLVTAWVALSPANIETGCMQFIPGSHSVGRMRHADTCDEKNILHRGQKVANVDESKAMPMSLAPGEASLHHGWVLHGSGPNNSNDRRIGLTIQYMRPSMRQTVAAIDSAILVRGRDEYGHFEADQFAVADMEPAAVAMQKRVDDRKKAIWSNA